MKAFLPGLGLIILISQLFTTDAVKKPVNNIPAVKTYSPTTNTLNKKVMFGYQGWHATPNDGAGNGVWRHWFGRSTPDSAVANFDVWPDMREYPASALEATNMTYPDGSKAMLYSAYKYEAVDVHFKWMQQHQLDGVFEQRFISDIKQLAGRKHFNQVVRNVKAASEKYKRVYCIMYDISGAGDNWKETLMADWKFLVDSLNVTTGSSYLHHKGKPLLSIWGLGFKHIPFATASQVDSLLDWFHTKAPKKYQATIMGGVNDDWRTHTDEWIKAYNKLDVLSPWAVGRYNSQAAADKFAAENIVPDNEYCKQHKIDYFPVIFPGFSWHNLRRGRSKFNQIPRDGGNFYWRQSYNVLKAGVNMVYVAMYDEVDEGTAMYKLAPTAAYKPVNGKFISADEDGKALPSDWYLQLAGATSNILRGNAANTQTIPLSPAKK
ncbi:MAG: xylosidase/arabinosidase [Sphingobacteriaceae bacterium]|nr:MAG: xylosidase/arabinosidase [Sphingobacteriaceae bacterium]